MGLATPLPEMEKKDEYLREIFFFNMAAMENGYGSAPSRAITLQAASYILHVYIESGSRSLVFQILSTEFAPLGGFVQAKAARNTSNAGPAVSRSCRRR